MHERISVNNLCFAISTLAEDVASWRSLGAPQIGIATTKMKAEGWDASVALLREAGFPVATMVQPFMLPGRLDNPADVAAGQQEMLRTLAAANALGARTVYTTAGGRGALSWEEAAGAFAEALAPCRAFAEEAGIALITEPAPALYADAHIAHSLRDTLALAEIAGIGVLIDLFSCWTEAGLRETIMRAGRLTKIVQVSDYVLGDRAVPCRAVPGDGAIPLERIIGWILETGFEGALDLELLGPRIDREGHYQAVARTCDYLGEMLVRLGA
jgi:sugar phosphate isomerase/epimerase